MKNFELLKSGMFTFLMSRLISDLGDKDKKERLWLDSDVLVCQFNKRSVVVASFVSNTS